MERLFVDTSGWIAYADRNEPRHAAVRELIAEFGGRLVTTDDVLNETLTLASRRLGHGVAVTIGDVLRDPDVVDVVHVDPRTRDEAFEFFRDRPDQTYSLTDCTSFCVMRRLGLAHAATLDSDFANEGFLVRP